MANDRIITLRVHEIYTSTESGAVSTINLAAQSANLCVPAPTDSQADTIRVYRRGGSLPESWFQSGPDFPISSLSAGGCGAGKYLITDNVPDDQLGKELELDNDVPVTSLNGQTVPLPFIWGPFLGRVLGCGDAQRSDAVYFSKSGNADQWGSANWVTVSNPSEPMQNGCVYNTRCFAFSTERLYELVSGLQTGVTFSPFPTPCAHGLISPWGLCSYDAIYFVSKDGIYVTTGGAEESIVENWIKPLFPTKDGPGVSVNGYEAVDLSARSSIRLTPHNDEIYFTYAGATTGTLQTLVWDVRKKRWRAAAYTPSIPTFYSEPGTASTLLLGGNDNELFQSTIGQDDDSAITVHVVTGSYDQGLPLNEKEYGNVIFDLDPGGATNALPVTITPIVNGGLQPQSAITVTGSGRQQVPLSLSDVYAFNLEFDIAFTRTSTINPILYQFDILWREEPVSVKHFEVRPTDHGIAGWQHVRDMYVELRSTSDVTLTLTLDGTTTQTYTIPSTAGKRLKQYLPMHSNKFKLLAYSFDAANEFRLYQIGSEARVKQWVAPLGYVVRKPFGADSTLTTAALEAQALRGGNG